MIAAGMFDRLGPVLRLLREGQGRAQKEVASAADLPKATLSKYESEALVPSVASLGRILAALGVDLAQLGEALDAANGRLPPEPEPRPAAEADPEKQVPPEALVITDLLLGGARDLSPEARQAFTEVQAALYRLSQALRTKS